VQGIVDVLQSGEGMRGRLIDLGRTLPVESFVRTLRRPATSEKVSRDRAPVRPVFPFEHSR
jgi:hypothetical protein